MTKANIITSLRQARGMTQAELAQRLNTSQTCISLWESKSRMPRDNFITSLAELFDISEEKLYKELLEEHESFTSGSRNSIQIILYDDIIAGQPTFSISEIDGNISISIDEIGSGSFFALRVHTDKMSSAHLPIGSIAIVKKQSYIEDGQIAVVRVNDGSAIIGYLYHSDKTIIINYADGSNDDIIDLVNNRIEIIGKVIAYQGMIK